MSINSTRRRIPQKSGATAYQVKNSFANDQSRRGASATGSIARYFITLSASKGRSSPTFHSQLQQVLSLPASFHVPHALLFTSSGLTVARDQTIYLPQKRYQSVTETRLDRYHTVTAAQPKSGLPAWPGNPSALNFARIASAEAIPHRIVPPSSYAFILPSWPRKCRISIVSDASAPGQTGEKR